MSIIDTLKVRIKDYKRRIVLNELEDRRMLDAAKKVVEEDLVEFILIGKEEYITDEYSSLKKCTIINPETSDLLDEYIEKLYELRKDKGLTKEQAKDLLLNDYMYFSCMLLLDNKADGIVSGVSHSSSSTLRPALQLIKGKEELVSSFFLMETNNMELGENGLFIFADCGLNQNPDFKELSIIAKHSIDSFKLLVENEPRVAFLSHSTHGSSKHEKIDKVKAAVEIAKQENNCLIDGELQLDAAIIPEVASIKCPTSPLKGRANVLVFPDIDSGNIGYKLVERFGKAKAYGPLVQGLKKPVNDLSRGSSIEDIIGVIIITALQV